MENKCAPGKKFTDGSCFTLDNLKDIATNYNQAHTDKILIENKTKRELLRELIPKFKKAFDCDNQICWLSTAPVKSSNDDVKKYTFRPKGPTKQYEWLSTKDIEDVIKQYENVHTEIKFLGAVPSDFDE